MEYEPVQETYVEEDTLSREAARIFIDATNRAREIADARLKLSEATNVLKDDMSADLNKFISEYLEKGETESAEAEETLEEKAKNEIYKYLSDERLIADGIHAVSYRRHTAEESYIFNQRVIETEHTARLIHKSGLYLERITYTRMPDDDFEYIDQEETYVFSKGLVRPLVAPLSVDSLRVSTADQGIDLSQFEEGSWKKLNLQHIERFFKKIETERLSGESSKLLKGQEWQYDEEGVAGERGTIIRSGSHKWIITQENLSKNKPEPTAATIMHKVRDRLSDFIWINIDSGTCMSRSGETNHSIFDNYLRIMEEIINSQQGSET
jgi:predicted nucleic acid-binding protein